MMPLNLRGAACAAATVLLLAGCGGGGDRPPTDPLAEVPPSASESSAGFMAYLRALVAAPSDTREPVALDGLDPPRPDNAEPEPLS